ncbi:phytanoyl-CoA dioxygenase family protein [Pseudomonas typographi]|uniref:Phytanoyl-CoA dioxygenase family protein n=1 Tax=Pseudomonas typographi TaxID=2715964 RepID=A0ABR7Z367_9PSED|nr:phytanoyl-CoA dioxygenase family protein [Pseudomonas typographi]MBD1554094.1 phytanoyl-CoA dioxygenase family protein [Pseudomonas typographi]MBD1588543.1 phytanoyl-CoA dioxygenase family protein [Pseudomonas typographi]MBD1599838.1 phytanoyl-CoA dioxygenase family protein [Pseudomonas typographi]
MPAPQIQAQAPTLTQLREVPAGTAPEIVKQIIDEDGGVIIKGLFSAQVDRFNAEMDPIVADWASGNSTCPQWMQEFTGKKTKRVTQLIRRSKTFREEMLDHDILLSYIDTMMLETSDAYWMNAAQIIEIQPGEKRQYLHRDLENYPVFRSLGPTGPEVMCNCLVALSEYTEEMGATRIIPGSQAWPNFNDRERIENSATIPVVMEKGDAFLYSGKVVHGGGANVSNRPRRALALAFCPGWLVPEEAYPFAVPLEMARTLSKRGQQLTGFRSQHNEKLGGGTLWSLDYVELAKVLELD